MITTTVRPATIEDAYMLGIIGPAAYAEAYAYLWDRPDVYSDHLQSFGQHGFEALLARTDARVWVGEAAGSMVGFLSMIIGSLDPVEHRLRRAELPPGGAADCRRTQRPPRSSHGPHHRPRRTGSGRLRRRPPRC